MYDRKVGDIIQSNWLIIAIYHKYNGKYYTETTARELFRKDYLKYQRRKKLLNKLKRQPKVIIINNYYGKKF